MCALLGYSYSAPEYEEQGLDMLHETPVEEIEVCGFSTDQHRVRRSVNVYMSVVAHLDTLPQLDRGSFQ